MPKIFTEYLSLKPESFTALFINFESGINKTSAIPISRTLSFSTSAPMITAATGGIGMKSNTMAAIIKTMIKAATGAL